MSERQDALDEIARIAKSHGLSFDEIAAALAPKAADTAEKSSSLVAKIFGYIGGLLVLGGVGVLIGMKWDELSPLGHVLITLLPGFAVFALGVGAARDERYEKMATPLFLLAAAVQPTGILVALKEYAHGDNPAMGVLFMCFVMLAQQGLVFLALRRTALAFTAAFFALNFLATFLDMQSMPGRFIGMMIGGVELVLAYRLDKSPHRAIAPFHYFFGSVIFLSSFGAWVGGTAAEILFLGAASAFIYASVIVRSRVMLGVSAVAMLSFIGYYSGKYFAHALGWPLALILTGILMAGMGAVVVRLNKRIARD